jgi:hypothetical protein
MLVCENLKTSGYRVALAWWPGKKQHAAQRDAPAAAILKNPLDLAQIEVLAREEPALT